MIKVIIIEDEFEIANYLFNEINSSDKYRVEKVYTNPIQFLEESYLEFDIVLLDIILPLLNGVDAIEPILEKYPSARIVMNTIIDDSDTIFKCLKKGVVGYINKQHFDVNYEEVFDVVVDDGAYMTPKIARKIIEAFNKPKSYLEKLTKREAEIVDAILQGLSYKLIANKYDISIDTVRVHIKSIYRKLKINSKGELFSMINKRL